MLDDALQPLKLLSFLGRQLPHGGELEDYRLGNISSFVDFYFYARVDLNILVFDIHIGRAGQMRDHFLFNHQTPPASVPAPIHSDVVHYGLLYEVSFRLAAVQHYNTLISPQCSMCAIKSLTNHSLNPPRCTLSDFRKIWGQSLLTPI